MKFVRLPVDPRRRVAEVLERLQVLERRTARHAAVLIDLAHAVHRLVVDVHAAAAAGTRRCRRRGKPTAGDGGETDDDRSDPTQHGGAASHTAPTNCKANTR